MTFLFLKKNKNKKDYLPRNPRTKINPRRSPYNLKIEIGWLLNMHLELSWLLCSLKGKASPLASEH